MSNFQPLIFDDSHSSPTGLYAFDFIEQTMDQVFLSADHLLETLLFQILTKPSALIVHLQRIYFCYRHDLAEELFAALLDLLIVLEGKGADLSQRMVLGAKPKLVAADYERLIQALSYSPAQIKRVKGNSYSVFSLGLIGSVELVVKKQNLPKIYDPLEIARDFMAYSQLEAAMEILEQAILEAGDRQALHDDLLELYRVTHSVERFAKMYARLSQQMTAMPVAWDELKGSFNER